MVHTVRAHTPIRAGGLRCAPQGLLGWGSPSPWGTLPPPAQLLPDAHFLPSLSYGSQMVQQLLNHSSAGLACLGQEVSLLSDHSVTASPYPSTATTCDHFTFHSFEPPSCLGGNLEHIVQSRPQTEREGPVLGRSWEWALQVWRTPAHTRSLLPAQLSLSRLHELQGQANPSKALSSLTDQELRGWAETTPDFQKVTFQMSIRNEIKYR